VLQALEEIKPIVEGPYGEFAKMDAVKQIAMVRALKGKDEDVRVKTDELAAKDGEIQHLQLQLEQTQVYLKCCYSIIPRTNHSVILYILMDQKGH
jgi:hypothetical protein